jgi:hypothetical protein
LKIEIINSEKFSKIADVIFSEVINLNAFSDLENKENLHVIDKTNTKDVSLVWYVAKKLNIADGNIVFCKTELVEYFFKTIEKNNNLKDLVLITSQSDIAVDKKLYSKKPKSVITWFAVNVVHQAVDLIPLPLGVNNSYVLKFPQEDDFIKNGQDLNQKQEKFYLNFNMNTNPFHRLHTILSMAFKKDTVIKPANISKTEYLDDLGKYRYIICPLGNGFDSHRIWEAIYSNSIGVVKKHPAFQTFEDLPLIQISNFININIESLSNDHMKDLRKADFGYWKKVLESAKTLSSKNSINIDFQEDLQEFLVNKNKYNKQISKMKSRRALIFKSYKFIFKILFYKKFKNLL